MKKLAYIRYEKKYRKWIDRLGISVSEEELKKGFEEEEDVEELDEDMIEWLKWRDRDFLFKLLQVVWQLWQWLVSFLCSAQLQAYFTNVLL